MSPDDMVDAVLLVWFVGCSAVASVSSDASTTKYRLSAMTTTVTVIASANDFIFFCPAYIFLNYTNNAGIKFRENCRS